MRELIVNLPDKADMSESIPICEMDSGTVFLDKDGDYSLVLDDGVLNFQSDGSATFYTFEEVLHYDDVFGRITPMPDYQATINIERS